MSTTRIRTRLARPAEPAEPKPDGRRARGDRTRQAVLECAVRIASVEGLEAMTLGHVAAESGVAKASIQTVFRTREELQVKTLDLAVVMVETAIARRMRPRAGALARLRELADAWFAVVDEGILPGGCLMTAAATEFRARPGILRDAVAAHRARWKALLLQTARLAISEGSLPGDANADALVLEIMALESAANGPCVDRADFELARKITKNLLRQAEVGQPARGRRKGQPRN